MMKNLIDKYFAVHYHLHRVVAIDEETTQEEQFDLRDESPFLFPFGDGYASFGNANKDKIHVLFYEEYIQKYAGTHFENGRLRCDFIVHGEPSAAIILNEITSSGKGMDDLKKPILKKDKRTGNKIIVYAGGKLEKAETQLLQSLQTLNEVPEIGSFFDAQLRKICLCSYKLYTSVDLTLIGNPVEAFNQGMAMIERETGENGTIVSCPDIENLGFEYRRISHNYSFRIN